MKNHTSGKYHIKHEVDIDITNVKLSSYNHINGHGPSGREIFENQKELLRLLSTSLVHVLETA